MLGTDVFSRCGGASPSARAPSVRIIARMPALSRWLQVNGQSGSNELRRDRRLEIREGQDKIGFQREDLRNVRRREGGDPRLLTTP
jgi:hypothetical protein